MLKVDEATVRRNLRHLRFAYLEPPGDPEEELEGFLEAPISIDVPASGIAVTADWHVPLVDYEFVNVFLEHCERAGIRELVIAGDFWNMDALSRFDYKQRSADLETEHYAGVRIFDRLLELFDRVYFTWGNHDARLHKALQYKLEFKQAMRMLLGEIPDAKLDKLALSNLDHLYVQTPRGPYRICHPATYNQRPLTTATRLAAKHGCHVITAHSHHCAVGYAEDGKTVLCEIGGMFDRTRTEYLQRTTTYPEWTPGYAFIRPSGRLYVASPGWST